MKKTVLIILLAGFLAGCASVGGKPAAVEDRSAIKAQQEAAEKAAAEKAAAEKAAQAEAETRRLQQGGIVEKLDAVNPLKDPASLLSQRSIYFDYDSAAVRDEYRTLLAAHAAYLTANKNAKVVLQGNTDERGSREYNLALGQRRADSVRKVLSVLGVPEAQMEAVSLGEEKPKAIGEGEEFWKENRRTDILYQGE